MEHRVAFFQGMTRVLLIRERKQDIYIYMYRYSIYIYMYTMLAYDIFITATRYISVHIHISKLYLKNYIDYKYIIYNEESKENDIPNSLEVAFPVSRFPFTSKRERKLARYKFLYIHPHIYIYAHILYIHI